MGETRNTQEPCDICSGYGCPDCPTAADLAPEVRVGQVWADNDRRCAGRYVKVLAIEPARRRADLYARDVPAKALVAACDQNGLTHFLRGKEQLTRIRLDRFRPTSTGYRLVCEARGDE